MCGIAGQVALAEGVEVDAATVRSMSKALLHRGPDGQGEFVSPSRQAALGHTRLSIIDLMTGNQPLFDESGTIAVVFNGEIYNFAELRDRLEALGHRFTSRSDTETIVHLYEEHGVECVRHLHGMFAFLLWDERRKRLVAARDRLGKKPLYYTECEGSLFLASELTALFELTQLDWTLDPHAVQLYLLHSYIPSPYAILSSVRKLPPAHVLVAEAGRVTNWRYWQPTEQIRDISEEEATREVARVVSKAVERRLISDVPLGALLSGGVDSSIVVAMMAKATRQAVRTFSMGFGHNGYDELQYARVVAEAFRTEHKEAVVSAEAAAILPRLVDHCGEPFGDSSAVPVWHVSELARRDVKVVLTGDGGDELFGGYRWYETGLRLDRLRRLLPSGVARWSRSWIASSGGRLLPRRVMRAVDVLTREAGSRFAALRRTVDDDVRAELYGQGLARWSDAGPRAYLERVYSRMDRGDVLQAMSLTDLFTYLPEDLLVKVDRMSMAWGLEARAPFLDTEVVELAVSLPSVLKRQGVDGKRILRKAFAGHFPPRFLERPKMGFSIPVDEWLRTELTELVEGSVLRGALVDLEIVSKTAVGRMWAAHGNGQSWGAILWNLVALAQWFERFGSRAVWPRATEI